MPVVRISDELFARLQKHAQPLVDTVNDVIERILNQYEGTPPTSTTVSSYEELWKKVTDEFNKLSPHYPARPNGVRAKFKKVLTSKKNIHYEWNLRSSLSALDVCLHFEHDDKSENMRRIKPVLENKDKLSDGISEEFVAGAWGDHWAEARFRIKYNGEWPDEKCVNRAAELMKILIDRTWKWAELA